MCEHTVQHGFGDEAVGAGAKKVRVRLRDHQFPLFNQNTISNLSSDTAYKTGVVSVLLKYLRSCLKNRGERYLNIRLIRSIHITAVLPLIALTSDLT